MSETWYKTGGYGRSLIEPVEIERFTDACVWIKGRRNARSTDFYNFYPTWQGAKDALVAKAEAKLERAKAEVERARSALDFASKLAKEPA